MILTGFYICGTLEPKLKIYFLSKNVSKFPAASIIFSAAPLSFVDQTRRNTYFCYGPPSYDMIYLLTAIGLSPDGRSTVHIYTQTLHRTIQNKQYIEQHNNFGRVRAVPRLG